MPPKRTIPGSSANYWDLDATTIANMQWTVSALDVSIAVFKEPHICVAGTVEKVIPEQDGDTHIWLSFDGSKDQIACEITPQNPLPPPTVGQHVRICGILRYDLQHGWSEIHPTDFIEVLP